MFERIVIDIHRSQTCLKGLDGAEGSVPDLSMSKESKRSRMLLSERYTPMLLSPCFTCSILVITS